MGLIINVILIVIVAVVLTGAVAYNNPQTAKAWAAKGLQKFIPDIIKVNPEEIVKEFINRLPKNIREIIDKNPPEEKDFKEDISFPELTPKKEILGRPRKVVEFFCTNDFQCKNYFLKNNAQCETESGICFINS